MTTPAQIAANQRNAQLSTGPRTDAGKAVAKMNALAHGLRAAAQLVPGEDPAQWDQFRDGVVASLAPVGALEGELAERVAVLSWRLRRVAAFEAGVVAAACEKAVVKMHFPSSLDRLMENDFDGKLGEMMAKTYRGVGTVRQELAGAEERAAERARAAELLTGWDGRPDTEPLTGAEAADLLERVAYQGPMRDDEHFELDDWELLEAAGVPEEEREEPGEWGGWTVGSARAGMAHLCSGEGDPLGVRLGRAVREAERGRRTWAAEAERLRAELAGIEAGLAELVTEARRKALLPAAETGERVMKYESHLSKQLTQALHELERLRAYRSDTPPPPPAVLDVTVHGAEKLEALTAQR